MRRRDENAAATNSTALTNNDLAASLSSGGRLSALLAAGISHPDADLTWFIDPALLGDAATMTHPYQVDPDCTGGQHRAGQQGGGELAGRRSRRRRRLSRP